MRKKYSLLQRIQIKLYWNAFIEYRKIYLESEKRWSDYLPFYAFRCRANPEHGIVESYPHSTGGRKFGGRLICPKCIKELDESETPD